MLILFGGYSSSGTSQSCNGITTIGNNYFGDIWQFSFFGSYWIFVNTTGSCPPSRSFHSMMRIASSQLLVFGGFNDDGTKPVIFGDLWYFNFREKSQQWKLVSCPANVGCPKARYSHSMVSTSSNGTSWGTAIMYAGRDLSLVFSDLWRWDSANSWQEIRFPSGPAGRYGHSARVSQEYTFFSRCKCLTLSIIGSCMSLEEQTQQTRYSAMCGL